MNTAAIQNSVLDVQTGNNQLHGKYCDGKVKIFRVSKCGHLIMYKEAIVGSIAS